MPIKNWASFSSQLNCVRPRRWVWRMEGYRGYISHCMWGGRSVPQNVQQLVIRNYCEKHGLTFLLSATEFEGHTIMLDGIRERGIVMYSIFCMPRDKTTRERLYASGKDVRFAAENMAMNPELVELTFYVSQHHESSEFHHTASYLNKARLSGQDESRKT